MISKETIIQCIHKERKAHKLCYETCAPYVYTIIKSYISDTDLRKDAMQEIFANIFNSMQSFDSNKGKFKTWIAQISINQCIAILRRRNKLKLFVPLEGIHENLEETDQMLNGLRKEEIEALLVKMPIGYKTVFLLSVVDDYAHKEIAELLDITKETSRSQLSRAINWIKKNKLTSTKNLIYG